jgi:hypothetical protein
MNHPPCIPERPSFNPIVQHPEEIDRSGLQFIWVRDVHVRSLDLDHRWDRPDLDPENRETLPAKAHIPKREISIL